MPSAFYGINIAGRAMQSFQYAMLTTSHNIANVNNSAYSRQIVDFRDGIPQFEMGIRPFYLGGGTEIGAVTRVRDRFLQQRYMDTSTEGGRFATLAANLKQAEVAFGELSTSSGISEYLDQFFNAFQQLSANPSDTALRSTVRQAADQLARRFRTLDADLATQQRNVTAQVQDHIGRLNQLAGDLATLNKRIVEAQATGATPNDLLDQRESILAEMSNIAEVRSNVMPNGTMQVYLDQFTLVDQSGANELSTTVDVATSSIVVNGLNIRVASGALGGSFETLNKLSGYRTQLDTLAGSIISEVNLLHSSGYALDGTTGHMLFSGTGASTFDLSDEVKASAQNIVAAATNEAGDGSLALAIAQLRSATHAGLGGRSFSGFYGDLVTAVASDLKGAQAALDAQSGIRQQIVAQIEAQSGVNLDEELANMMKYQRTYEAAARLLTIFDSVLEETIGLLGR